MATAKDTLDPYPHIATCDEQGDREPYVLDTGLTVWEIAWLTRGYDGDIGEVVRHTGVDSSLIEEGLRYAGEHTSAIDAQVRFHTKRSLEELLALLPGAQVIDVKLGTVREPTA